MGKYGKYNKFWAAVLTGILAWGVSVVNSERGTISSNEWISLAGIFVTAVTVYLIPNTDEPVE